VNKSQRLHSINVSDGGVPKAPRASACVRVTGVEGDRQRDRRFHGGPDRAVSLYSLELILALQAEGHPIVVGSIGENLTLSGVDWAIMRPGIQIQIGEVTLEITKPAHPCEKIGAAFLDRGFTRVSQKVCPGWSRFYACVVEEGRVATGDEVAVSRHDRAVKGTT
jgi:MOSC domain-containing protein YiiM